MTQVLRRKVQAGNDDADHERKIIYGYDRLKFWLDRPELPIHMTLLLKHCTKIEVFLEEMHYNSRWKLRVELFQPSIECLRLLNAAMGHDIAALLNYVEFVCDVPSNSKKQARQRRDSFLASARMRYQRQPVVLDKNNTSHYFGSRFNKKGKKRVNVLAVYADKPSKINNVQPAAGIPPCLHIEKRSTGTATLRGLGIVTLLDLIQFDHQRFWNEHMCMYELPKPTKLGRLLAKDAGKDINVTNSALRKRAALWKQKHSIANKFVLHNAILANPNILRSIKKLLFVEFINLI